MVLAMGRASSKRARRAGLLGLWAWGSRRETIAGVLEVFMFSGSLACHSGVPKIPGLLNGHLGKLPQNFRVPGGSDRRAQIQRAEYW